MTRTDGFEASRPFLEVVPNTPGMRIQIDNPASDPVRAKAALKRSQTDLARLCLWPDRRHAAGLRRDVCLRRPGRVP